MTIRDDFEQFHRDNPQVYFEMVRLTRELHDAGHRIVGAKMLWEVMRWQRMRIARPTSSWKLNNNFTAHYARLIMDNEPDLAGIFNTRESTDTGDQDAELQNV